MRQMARYSGRALYIIWLIRVASIAFAFLFVLLLVGSCIASKIMAKDPPPIDKAPWAVQTSSRVYYAKQYGVVNGVPTISQFWMNDGKNHYIFTDGTMPFPQREFGQIAVVRRSK